MTDYSGWTDEQVNEAIAVKRGWVLHLCVGCNHDWWMTPDGGVDYNQQDPPYYTHDWRLCGELLEEMKEADVNLQYYPTLNKWGCEWIQGTPMACDIREQAARTPQRAICEAWLAWKELE